LAGLRGARAENDAASTTAAAAVWHVRAAAGTGQTAHGADGVAVVAGAAEALHATGSGQAYGHRAAASVAYVAGAEEYARLAVALISGRTVAASAGSLRSAKIMFKGI
jgi:hypothetical protein